VYYWGDIDSHGFAILSQVREVLVQSAYAALSMQRTQSMRTGVGASVKQRVKWSIQLTAPTLLNMSYSFFLAGFDRWNPVEASGKLP